MSRILLTGGGAGTQAIWDHWHRQHTLYFADANLLAMSESIPKAHRLQIPFASDPQFLSKLQEACRQRSVDLVIPGVDEELAALSRCNGVPDWPRLLVPQPGFVDTMTDKLDSMRALAAAGLDTPATATLADEAGVHAVGWPMILKPRKGRGSRGVMAVQRPEQVPAYLALHGLQPKEVVAQALVQGQEYTVFVYADAQARLRAVVPVRVLQKRGITISACTEDHPAIVAYVQALQQAMQPTGPYNLQCILTEKGSVVPFEVNPRISTTFCLALAAGADPLVLDEAIASEVPPVLRVSRVWHLHRTWLNHISALPAL